MINTDWKLPRINKGGGLSRMLNGHVLIIVRVDRTIDQYLACVVDPDEIIIYTGLHATLADARRKCEAEAMELNND